MHPSSQPSLLTGALSSSPRVPPILSPTTTTIRSICSSMIAGPVTQRSLSSAWVGRRPIAPLTPLVFRTAIATSPSSPTLPTWYRTIPTTKATCSSSIATAARRRVFPFPRPAKRPMANRGGSLKPMVVAWRLAPARPTLSRMTPMAGKTFSSTTATQAKRRASRSTPRASKAITSLVPGETNGYRDIFIRRWREPSNWTYLPVVQRYEQ